MTLSDHEGPWMVDIVFNDGEETLRGGEPMTNQEFIGLVNNIGEPAGALGVMNEDAVLVVVPASRVKEVHAREVSEDD